MTQKPEPQPGDWIAFQRQGVLTHSRVEYVRQGERWPHKWQAITLVCAVEFDDVLEVRRGA